VHSIAVCLELPPIVVPILRVCFMSFWAFGPGARRNLGDQYATACTFSASFLHTEDALRLMTILPLRKPMPTPCIVPFPFPLHVLTHGQNTVLSTDSACYPWVPFAMIDDSSLFPFITASSSSSCARDQHRDITKVVVDTVVVVIFLALVMSACRAR
jgi:hypothetical protein